MVALASWLLRSRRSIDQHFCLSKSCQEIIYSLPLPTTPHRHFVNEWIQMVQHLDEIVRLTLNVNRLCLAFACFCDRHIYSSFPGYIPEINFPPLKIQG